MAFEPDLVPLPTVSGPVGRGERLPAELLSTPRASGAAVRYSLFALAASRRARLALPPDLQGFPEERCPQRSRARAPGSRPRISRALAVGPPQGHENACKSGGEPDARGLIYRVIS
jgi:hypothetical protein